jgi:phosphocarrier protein HPr
VARAPDALLKATKREAMKTAKVEIRWKEGLHLRPAARLVRVAQCFNSTLLLRLGHRTANLRSILHIVGLCAMLGATLDVEGSGDDEDAAVTAIERAFQADDDGTR